MPPPSLDPTTTAFFTATKPTGPKRQIFLITLTTAPEKTYTYTIVNSARSGPFREPGRFSHQSRTFPCLGFFNSSLMRLRKTRVLVKLRCDGRWAESVVGGGDGGERAFEMVRQEVVGICVCGRCLEGQWEAVEERKEVVAEASGDDGFEVKEAEDGDGWSGEDG